MADPGLVYTKREGAFEKVSATPIAFRVMLPLKDAYITKVSFKDTIKRAGRSKSRRRR